MSIRLPCKSKDWTLLTTSDTWFFVYFFSAVENMLKIKEWSMLSVPKLIVGCTGWLGEQEDRIRVAWDKVESDSS